MISFDPVTISALTFVFVLVFSRPSEWLLADACCLLAACLAISMMFVSLPVSHPLNEYEYQFIPADTARVPIGAFAARVGPPADDKAARGSRAATGVQTANQGQHGQQDARPN